MINTPSASAIQIQNLCHSFGKGSLQIPVLNENVTMPLKLHPQIVDRQDRAIAALSAVGLADRTDYTPTTSQAVRNSA